LAAHIADEVDEFNRKRGFKELILTTHPNPFHQDKVHERSIVVRRADGDKCPLTITYFPASHRISCECGGGKKDFILKVTDDRQIRFETPYHVVSSIEEIGNELLTMFRDSQL
jgi:hypothetical protein